jgi:HSP20 family protein
MATLTRYNPFRDLEEFTGLRMFEDTVNRLLNEPASTRPWAPPVDIMESENELVIKADLPEIDLKDVDIRLENNQLSLKGERKFESKKENGGYHRIERSYGSFVRYFTLPNTVDTEKVNASYRDGVLTIVIPKKEAAKPRQVKVEVQSNGGAK